MNRIQKTFGRIRQHGLRYVLTLFVQNRIIPPANRAVQRVCNALFKKTPLQDAIIIESHNDFDCNGGAFYQFLIQNGYNRKYRIIWLLKHSRQVDLPGNVRSYNIFRPSFAKSFYICTAQYFCADDRVTDKVRPEQKSFYLGHGIGGLKNAASKIHFSDSIDYILLQSETYAPTQAKAYSLNYPDKRFIYIGYPTHDVLNGKHEDELLKITQKKHRKVVLWMPTFRRGGGDGRVDSDAEQPLGIPLIDTIEAYQRLDALLASLDIYLIIKIHPMQDMSTLKIYDTDNIRVLTGANVKQLGIDNYKLMTCTDALISDYSAAAFEYLQVNHPIAYVLSDMHEYKLGFVVEDINTLIAGDKLLTYEDMTAFLKDVADGVDRYCERRQELRDYIYKYHDGDNCKRLAEFMGLMKQPDDE